MFSESRLLRNVRFITRVAFSLVRYAHYVARSALREMFYVLCYVFPVRNVRVTRFVSLVLLFANRFNQCVARVFLRIMRIARCYALGAFRSVTHNEFYVYSYVEIVFALRCVTCVTRNTGCSMRCVCCVEHCELRVLRFSKCVTRVA